MPFNKAGTLLVSNFWGNSVSAVFPNEESYNVVETDPGTVMFQDIILDSQSNFYIADWKKNVIYRFTSLVPGAASAETFVDLGASGLYGPIGMAVDAYDNIYVACQTSGKVVKIRQSNRGIENIVTNLNSPTGLVFDYFENLYVSTANDNRIWKIDNTSNHNKTIFLEDGILNRPEGLIMIFDVYGKLYIANKSGGNILRTP